jgi:cytochrome c oxidase assembly factor CtaG
VPAAARPVKHGPAAVAAPARPGRAGGYRGDVVLTALAGGYHGPPALTVSRALTSWTLDLPALLAVLLAGGLYLAGVRRLRRSGRGWGTGRALAFGIGGLGGLVVATMSFLGVYQDVLFYVRSAQTIVLLLVVPLFLVLGAPLTLLGAAAPRAGQRLDAVLHSRAARLLTFPAITTAVLVLVPFVLYFSPWYAASLRSAPVRELTYLALVAIGFVFFWMFLRIDPVPRAYPYLVALWVSAAEVVGDAALGLAVLASQSLLAGGYYRALGRPWGPSLHADQIIGGGVLWILGDLVGLPFLAAQFIRMMREDESQARAVDAELDAAEAARAAAAAPAGTQAARTETARTETAGVAAAGTETAPDGSQPWWEDDPRLAGRFRRPGRPPQ